MHKIFFAFALFVGLLNVGFASDDDESAAESSSEDKTYIPWTWDDIDD
ncbi:hypothetical protein [Thiohalomonas denitrificans]|uniref:Uncharacterized protein n=1 Tax=Thiohalomonas denitrificans TaxID=415747 RepID=A0A1G5QW23_9GAMM|nr:hypothetical protein [Thiohalomonas denitrificans]SCZ65942.1 hypothetical protein SAMN03097708_02905 [Thiohalomonas denitrificans]